MLRQRQNPEPLIRPQRGVGHPALRTSTPHYPAAPGPSTTVTVAAAIASVGSRIPCRELEHSAGTFQRMSRPSPPSFAPHFPYAVSTRPTIVVPDPWRSRSGARPHRPLSRPGPRRSPVLLHFSNSRKPQGREQDELEKKKRRLDFPHFRASRQATGRGILCRDYCSGSAPARRLSYVSCQFNSIHIARSTPPFTILRKGSDSPATAHGIPLAHPSQRASFRRDPAGHATPRSHP